MEQFLIRKHFIVIEKKLIISVRTVRMNFQWLIQQFVVSMEISQVNHSVQHGFKRLVLCHICSFFEISRIHRYRQAHQLALAPLLLIDACQIINQRWTRLWSNVKSMENGLIMLNVIRLPVRNIRRTSNMEGRFFVRQFMDQLHDIDAFLVIKLMWTQQHD